MLNSNNIFEDKNNNDIPDIIEGGNADTNFNSVQFIIKGKKYKSLDEMPPDVRARVEEEFKLLSQTSLDLQPLFGKSFSSTETPDLVVGEDKSFENRKGFAWLYPLLLILLFNGIGLLVFFNLDPNLQHELGGPFIFYGITLIFFVIAGYFFISQLLFKRKSHLAMGKVIALVPSYGRHGLVFRPIIEFLTLEGKKLQTTTKTATNPCFYKVDQEVQIYYDPNNPASTLVKSFFDQWGMVLIFIMIGIFLLVLALLESWNYFDYISEAFLQLFTSS